MPTSISVALSVLAENLKRTHSNYTDLSRKENWRKGDLSYKMWPVQLKMSEIMDTPVTAGHGSLKKVINCSRRLRKTSTALIKSVEKAIKKFRALIRFAAPTRDQLVTIVEPLMQMICEDSPDDIRPIWKPSQHHYYFPLSESKLFVAGCDNIKSIGRLRGKAADLCVVDEAQDIVHLKYLVDDVLMPQLLGIDDPRGPLWILLTPPKTPIHDCVSYVTEAKSAGTYAEFDIYRGEYSEDVIEIFKKEAGGESSTTWKREYLVQFVVDKNFSIIPEWKDEYIVEYKPDEFYKFYDKYEGMDIGVRHKTVCLFSIYDFKLGKLVVQDELYWSGPEMTTQLVSDGIKKKESELWGSMKPRLRISDNNNLILLQDLGILHGLPFTPTDKDTLEAMVNELRLWVDRGKIVVSPKCEQLIGSLKYGVWNDNRTDWEESILYGHFDALAALMYMVRYIDQSTNPIPKFNGMTDKDMFIHKNERSTISENAKTFKKVFKVKQ